MVMFGSDETIVRSSAYDAIGTFCCWGGRKIVEEQIENCGRDDCSLWNAILHLPGFGLVVVVLDVCLSDSDEVGDTFLVVRMVLGCENFGDQVRDRDNVKNF